jgi:hypothetical protein
MNDEFYEALIAERVTGPYTFDDLMRMAARRAIDELTQVRKGSTQEWVNWGEVEAANRKNFYAQQQAAPVTPPPPPIPHRENVHPQQQTGFVSYTPLPPIPSHGNLQPQQQIGVVSYIPLQPVRQPKSRAIYIILALLFGEWGFHNFYAGRYPVGLTQVFFWAVTAMVTLEAEYPWPFLLVLLWPLLDAVFVTKDGNNVPMT